MREKLEYRDEKSQKFWEIRTDGKSHTVRFGRIGSTGQTKTKSFSSDAAAVADAQSQAAKKRKKGYRDVSPNGTASDTGEEDGLTFSEDTSVESPTAKAQEKNPKPTLDRYVERIDAVARGIKDEVYRDEDHQRLTKALAYIRGESSDLPSFEEEGDFTALTKIFAPLSEWTGVDERVMDILATRWIRKAREHEWGFHEAFYEWLAPQIAAEGEVALYPLAVEKVTARKIDPETQLRHTIAELADHLEGADGEPSSVGRFILERYPAHADAMLETGAGKRYGTQLGRLLARHAREEFDARLPAWWKAESEWGKMQLSRALLEVDGAHYRSEVEACLATLEEGWPRFQVAETLFSLDHDAFREQAREIAEAALDEIRELRNGKKSYSDAAWDSSTKRFKSKTPMLLEFLLSNFGHGAKDAVFGYIENTKSLDLGNLELAAQYLGQDALEMVAEGFGVPIEDKDDVRFLSRLLRILNQLDWSAHHDQAWDLVVHKSKPVREAAAVGVAGIGPSVVARATELSLAKKQDHRHGAALILGLVGDAAALEALAQLVAVEKSDDVRDHALAALDHAMASAGRVVDDAMVEARFLRAQSAKKLDKCTLKWLDEASLPALEWKTGGALSPEWVRYLFYRQGRQSGAQIDVELRPVLARIETQTSLPFAAALWQGFLAAKANAKDKLCLVLAGALGGEGIVEALAASVDFWASAGRGALAEVGVHVLARIDSVLALRQIDELRRGAKGVASNVVSAAEEAFVEAADRQGVSAEELADRVVPDLGFDGPSRALDVGGEEWTVRIGMDFKLRYTSPAGKAAKSLPRGADKELKAEMKELAKVVKAVALEQRDRLEAAMVLGRRWTPARYRELMLDKAIREPFAIATVWGRYDDAGAVIGTFRSLGDGSLSTAEDEEVTLEAGDMVGLVHPAEVDAQTREAWSTHFNDHELVPLLSQLDRPVVRCPRAEAERKFYDGVFEDEVNAGTFCGRAGRLGWRRGSVVDAGEISAFHKSFGPAGVDVIIKVSGVSITGEHYDDATLGHVMFVKDGAVAYGSYTYDEPRNEADGRLMSLGEVPVVVYSEVVGDLAKIVGNG